MNADMRESFPRADAMRGCSRKEFPLQPFLSPSCPGLLLDGLVGFCEELMAQAVVSGSAVWLQTYTLFAPTLYPLQKDQVLASCGKTGCLKYSFWVYKLDQQFFRAV